MNSILQDIHQSNFLLALANIHEVNTIELTSTLRFRYLWLLSYNVMRTKILFHLVLMLASGCHRPLSDVSERVSRHIASIQVEHAKDSTVWQPQTAFAFGCGALLATRFQTFDDLRKVVIIEYFSNGDPSTPDPNDHSQVRLTHQCCKEEVVGILESGLSQGDISKVQQGGIWSRIGLVFDSPYAIAHRADLQRIYTLSRRRPQWYGEGDVAFFDLAKVTVEHINTPDLAFKYPRDTSEKGYLNTFNHVTAQALITSFFSEEIADFVADLHERENLPSLVTGMFTLSQLADSEANPIDNYVDVVNNEMGQSLGLRLKTRYNICRETFWTPELLASYLNELQSYYGWAFQIGFMPFRPNDEVVVRFSHKVNLVMRNNYP